MTQVVCSNVFLDVKATGYLASHVGWREPMLSVIVAISRAESGGNAGTYRPESENPGGGRDMGVVQINDKYWPKPDPFTRFHPITCLEDALAIWQRAGFGPWGLLRTRTEESLGVPAIRAELGDNPYDIARSPYRAMKAAGVDVMDLSEPDPTVYASPLPDRVMRYGNNGGTTGALGDDINRLQRILDGMGRWGRPGQFDRYYGGTVAAGVASIQRDLTTLGFWSGPVDGKAYDIPLRTAWDGLMRAEYLGLVI